MTYKESKSTGWMIVIHITLMLTAGLILIYTFEFPDILRKDMQTTLGLFIQNSQYTVPAYYLFTMTGISFMMIVMLIYKVGDFQKSTTGFMAVIFGVLFGLTSSLGFIRWPFLMEFLGGQLQTASAEKVEDIRLIYESFHIYAGVSVGENFAFWFEFLWMFLASTSLLAKPDVFPSYLARIGQVLGLGMLVYSLEQFGGVFEVLGPLNMVVHTAQLGWLLGLALCFFNAHGQDRGTLTLSQQLGSIGLFLVLVTLSFI